MKKKKGFSLIELLAVIIILAILALITIPVVGNLIKQARINSAVVSAYGYVEATNNEIVSKSTKGENVVETQYEIVNSNVVGDSLNVRYEGKGPDKGWFVIYKSKVTSGEFCINGYEVRYVDGVATYVENGEYCAPPPRPVICRINSENNPLDYDETTTFEVGSVEDLVCLSKLVNDEHKTFQGKTIILTKDIDFSSDSSYTDPNAKLEGSSNTIKKDMTDGKLVPIGNSSYKFMGTFDGEDKTISNLKISRTGSYTGLFGYIGSSGIVTRLNIKDSNITGGQYTGGIAGYNTGSIRYSKLDNLRVTGSNYTGGIAGVLDGNSYYVTSFNGSVSGGENTGGAFGRLAMENNTNPYFNNIVVSSNVSGSRYVGGLYGNLYYSTNKTLSGVMTGGSVTGSSNVGKVNGSTDNYFNGHSAFVSSSVTKSGSGGYDGGVYDSTKPFIGVLDDILDTWYGGDSDGDNYYFDLDSNNNVVMLIKDANTFDVHLSGSGTELDPYILSTERDFKEANLKLVGGYYFKINNDINVGNFNQFYQLGTNKNPFSGHLDGNNKVISNMNINTGLNGGFIGSISNGSIKDLAINSSSVRYIHGTTSRFGDSSKTGLLVGLASNTTISNITIGDDQTINGYNYTGGLIGYLSGTSTVNNVSIGAISVTGELNYTGGLIGQETSGSTVSEVVINSATVTGKEDTGGAIGYNQGNFRYSYVNDITVSGTNYVGGIIGVNDGHMKYVTVSGSVSGNEQIGGAIGRTDYTHNINSSFNNIVVYADVEGTSRVGGMFGSVYYTSNQRFTGVVAGGSQKGNSYVGKVMGSESNYFGGSQGNKVYVSSTFNKIQGSGGYDGRVYDVTKGYLGMLDDVLDTWYGGDTDGDNYYFDLDSNNKIVMIKKNEHSFDVTLQGSGTQSDPFILSTEKDFKDANVKLAGGYYFRIANDIDMSVFSQIYQIGTNGNPFNGHIDGNNKIISNFKINSGENGGFIGNSTNGSIKDLTLNNSEVNYLLSTVNKGYDTSKTGLLVGLGSGVTISNISITGTGSVSGYKYTGGIIGSAGGTSPISTININNLTVSGNEYTGGLAGSTGSSVSIVGVNINSLTLSGSNVSGGIAGYTNGSVKGCNVVGTVTGSERTGGIVGGLDGTIMECTFRGSVTGTKYTGGIAGRTQEGSSSNAYIYSVLVNANVSGTQYVGGIFGIPYYGARAVYGVVQSGRVSGNSNVGKAAGYASSWTGKVYVSTNVTGGGTSDGTSYDASDAGLTYYGSLKYNTNRPYLESSSTGDVNGSGWYFAYDSNGYIIAVPVGSTSPVPSQPVCTNCSNPTTYPLSEPVESSGTCPEGVVDNTPPTCTFGEFVAVNGGIRASFSCTDDTSVPTVASMFNSTTNAIYSYNDILDSSRGGTIKNGSVSGNTRSVTSTWTETTVPSNPPQRGACYYYQLAAVDQCGNESDYVTEYCYYGFSNAAQ